MIFGGILGCEVAGDSPVIVFHFFNRRSGGDGTSEYPLKVEDLVIVRWSLSSTSVSTSSSSSSTLFFMVGLLSSGDAFRIVLSLPRRPYALLPLIFGATREDQAVELAKESLLSNSSISNCNESLPSMVNKSDKSDLT
jgi:hypothetical protein